MIVHAILFLLGGLCGMCVVAVLVIARDADRIGRPRRDQ